MTSGNIGERAALTYAYGLWLMGGGRPDDFLDLSDYDAQVLIATSDGIRVRETNALLKGICKMFGGGEDN